MHLSGLSLLSFSHHSPNLFTPAAAPMLRRTTVQLYTRDLARLHNTMALLVCGSQPGNIRSLHDSKYEPEFEEFAHSSSVSHTALSSDRPPLALTNCAHVKQSELSGESMRLPPTEDRQARRY